MLQAYRFKKCKFEIKNSMSSIIINTKNKKQEKIIQDFLDSHEISYYTEVQEEQALYEAIKKGAKTKSLNNSEKEKFLKSLKNAK